MKTMFTPASNQRSRTYTSVLPNFSSTPLQLSCSSVAAVERIRTLKPSKNHAYTPQPSLLIVLSCLNSLYFLYSQTPSSSSALLQLFASKKKFQLARDFRIFQSSSCSSLSFIRQFKSSYYHIKCNLLNFVY